MCILTVEAMWRRSRAVRRAVERVAAGAALLAELAAVVKVDPDGADDGEAERKDAREGEHVCRVKDPAHPAGGKRHVLI